MADEATTPTTRKAGRAGSGRPSGSPAGGGPGGPGGPGGRKFFRRKKVCKFCTEKIDAIPYRDVRLLQGFVAERGKIVPRRLTGVCTTHQRASDAGHQAGAQHRPAAVRRALLSRANRSADDGLADRSSCAEPHVAGEPVPDTGDLQWKSF